MWMGIAVIGLAAVLLLGVAMRFIPQPVAVWPWQALLVYRGGRCRRVLGPGRHWAARDGLNELVHVTVAEQAGQLGPVDAVAREGFGVRLTLGYSWTVADPAAYHEASLGRSAFTGGVALPGFDNAFGAAVASATAGVPLAELLTNSQPVAAAVLDALANRWPSVTLTGVTVVKVTVPPEVRRLLTEVEAARLQGLAALERARGEQAALRGLANAARLVRDNPELAQLRLLQAIETAKRPATIVLGSAAVGVGGGA